MLSSLQHPLQLLHPALNLRLQFGEIGENLLRRTVRDLLMHNLFIAVETEVIVLRYQIRFGHTETLSGARTFALAAVAFSPSGEDVGQVVLAVLIGGEVGLWHRAQF